MSKLNKKLLQFEKVKKNPIKYIIPIVIAILVLIALILLLINGRKITDKIGITKSAEEKRAQEIESNLDDYKKYDRESGLIVSQFNVASEAWDNVGNVVIKGVSLSADSKGYKIKVSFRAINKMTDIEILGIYIDNYETEVDNINQIIHATKEKEQEFEFIIKKTQLDKLGINDFEKITFYMHNTFERDYSSEKITNTYTYASVSVQQANGFDNTISDKVMLDEIAGTKIYYNKITEDKENYYLYFIFEDKLKSNTYHIFNINKLLINGKIYDAKLKFTLKPGSRDVKYIVITKKEVDKIEKASISFIVRNYSIESNGKVTATYFTNQKEFSTKIKES